MEESGGKFRHIARNHKAPVGVRSSETGFDAAQRTAFRARVGHNGKRQVTVYFRLPHQDYASGGRMHSLRNILDQRGAAEGQQRFVRTHPRTSAARQDESRTAHRAMIPLHIIGLFWREAYN